MPAAKYSSRLISGKWERGRPGPGIHPKSFFLRICIGAEDGEG